MTTTVTITVERREGVLVVPRGAVRRGTTGSIVYRPRGNEIEERAVVTGAHDDSYWEIVDGLDEGDTVLVGRVSAGLEPSR
jgi:multidrug efflux pump subunit AcrA (membrane-fusion protein)